MKKFMLLMVGMLVCGHLKAQIGVSGAYKTFDAPEWYGFFQNGNVQQPLKGYAVGLDYWFRLKKRRIEFLPEFSFERYDGGSKSLQWKHQVVAFHFNVNIYLFDLTEDCNCPTFSKQGGLLKKGFFVQLSPGYRKFNNKLQEGEFLYEDGIQHWTAGIGAGLDVGISDFLTLTPLVKYYYSTNNSFKYLDQTGTYNRNVTSSIQQLYAGLRIGFRWQGRNKYGYR